jgi:protein-disulfide isomerase
MSMTTHCVRRSLRPAWAALLILFILPGCGDDESNDGAAAQTPPTEEAQDAQDPQVVNLADLGFDEGEEGEDRLYVVEFSDFGCIHCARFHMESYGALHEEFIEDDLAVWKYIPIAIGGFPNGPEAAFAGQCAGEIGDFAPMRDHLYEHQREWSSEDVNPAIFLEYAETLGYDVDAFEACWTDPATQEQIILHNRVAIELGVNATPTFLIQGHPLQGAPGLEDFQTILRDMLEQIRNP